MDETAGYAIGFQRLIDMIVTLLHQNEHIGSALRTQTQAFPGTAEWAFAKSRESASTR